MALLYRNGCSVLAVASLAICASMTTDAAAEEAVSQADTSPRGEREAGDGEIIVTARRQSERLSDVPLSVAAISPRSLESYGAADISSIQNLTPNVQIGSPYGPAQPNYTIRGIGAANQFQVSSASPIGVYVDEVYQSFRASQGLQLFDLDRIEVLKGPQGTLFGRNVTGGVVSMYTRQPMLDNDAHGYAQVGYGNYDRITATAGADFTLVEDKLGLRVAAMHASGDGFINNVAGGKDFNSVNMTAVRGILRAKPTDTLDVSLSVSYGRSNPIAAAIYWAPLLPGGTNAAGQTRESLGLRSPYDADCDDCGRVFSDILAVSLRTELELSDAASIISVTSYDNGNSRQLTDCDGSSVGLCNFDTNIDGSSLSQDIRLNYQGSGFNFVVGGYYGTDELYNANAASFFLGLANFAYTGKQERRTAAIYAEGTVELAPRLELSIGARLNHDVSIQSDYQAFVLDQEGGVPIANLVPSNGGGPLNPNLFVPTQREEETYVPYRVILNYKLNPDVMVYGSFSHGFRGGNFNTQAFNSPDELVYIGPERANVWEVGTKATNIGGFLNLNIAGFYTDYKGQQVLQTIGVNNTLAALDGYIYGFELDARARVAPGLTLYGGFGLLRSKYTDGQIGGSLGTTGVPGIFPVRGNPFPFAPRETFQVGFDWNILDNSDGKLTLSSNGSYTGRFSYLPDGDQQLDAASTARGGSDPYFLWDANISYRFGDIELGAWVKNITKQTYFPYYVNTESLGYDYFVLAAPRTYGASVKVHF